MLVIWTIACYFIGGWHDVLMSLATALIISFATEMKALN